MNMESNLSKQEVKGKPEIERKFILTSENLSFLDLKNSKHTEIRQGWYKPNKDAKRLRIRQEVDLKTGEVKYTRTAKTRVSTDMLERNEAEEVINEEEFLKYFGECDYFIVKERYYYEDKIAGLLEIDVFRDREEIIIEKEFKTRKEAELFQPLPWFGPEVTQIPEFTNKSMAKESRIKY